MKYITILLSTILYISTILCAQPQRNRKTMTPNNTFSITSSAFTNNQHIPSKYTGEGEDVSPQMQWSNAPANTKSFVLIVDDPDAPTPKPFIHWLLYNIPANIHELPEGTTTSNFMSGINDFGNTNYGGPMPPSGTHRYYFRLYALDTTLTLPKRARVDAIRKAMKGHVLAEATLMGVYQRKK